MRPADLAPDTLRCCLKEYARVIFYFSHFLSQVGYRAHQSDDGAGDTHQNSPKQSAMKADRSGESGKDSVSAACFFPACACTRVNSYTRGDVTSLTTEIYLVCFVLFQLRESEELMTRCGAGTTHLLLTNLSGTRAPVHALNVFLFLFYSQASER